MRVHFEKMSQMSHSIEAIVSGVGASLRSA
jgi:hypothetical protein